LPCQAETVRFAVSSPEPCAGRPLVRTRHRIRSARSWGRRVSCEAVYPGRRAPSWTSGAARRSAPGVTIERLSALASRVTPPWSRSPSAFLASSHRPDREVGQTPMRSLVPTTTSPGRAPCATERPPCRGSAPGVSHPLGGFLAGPSSRRPTAHRSRVARSTRDACAPRAPPRGSTPLPSGTFPFRAFPSHAARSPLSGSLLPRRSSPAHLVRRPFPESPGFPRRPRPSGLR